MVKKTRTVVSCGMRGCGFTGVKSEGPFWNENNVLYLGKNFG
jgi:hypothetical protein